MKKLILGILLASAVFGVNGQDVEKESLPVDETSKAQKQIIKPTEEAGAFIDYEQMPQFKGGEKALWKYLKDSLTYPKAALENKIKGRVIVRFLIDKIGATSKIEVIRGIGYGCDEEVVRLIQKMPRWIPGEQFGKPVDVWYTLPIVFTFKK